MRTDVYTCLCLHQAILLSCLNYFPDFYEINQTDNCPCRIRNLIGPTNNKFRNFFLDKSLRPSRYLVPVLSLGTINPGKFGNSFHTCLSIGNVFSYVSG